MNEILHYNTEELITIEVEEKVQEECGNFLVCNFDQRYSGANIQVGYIGALGLQHRGQKSNGAVYVNSSGEFTVRRRDGLMHDSFYDPLHDKRDHEDPFSLSENSPIVGFHCRYGTSGGYDEEYLQPCQGRTIHGERFFEFMNGQYAGIEDMRRSLQVDIPDDANDVFIHTQKISETPGDTRDKIVVNAFNNSNGAFSAALIFDDALYLARDQFGLRPFYLGKFGENGWVAASETHALEKVRIPVHREVRPGEIIRIDEKGLTVLQEGSFENEHFCDFELPYFSRPDSLYDPRDEQRRPLKPEDWKMIHTFRERCGELLALQAQLDLDVVVGVPDSGVPIGTGYAIENGTPYRQWILRDHYDPNSNQRLFQDDYEMHAIGKKVIRKLSILPDKKLWRGKRVGMIDDSIVRGNVSENITDVLWSLGAEEVHVLSGFPPVMHTCHLGVSMRTEEELIAARNNGNMKAIASEIGATSVHFITPENFLQARHEHRIVIPDNPQEIFLRNGGCGGCVTGIYPVSPEGVVYELKSMNMLLNK